MRDFMFDNWFTRGALVLVGFLFGADHVSHQLYAALVVLMALDLGTGIWKARKAKEVSSDIAWRSTVKKFASMLVVIVAARMAELIISLSLVGDPGSGRISAAAAVMYLSTGELISINENLQAASGIGLGPILMRFLKAAGNGSGTNSR